VGAAFVGGDGNVRKHVLPNPLPEHLTVTIEEESP
jgi:hypothetical protein